MRFKIYFFVLLICLSCGNPDNNQQVYTQNYANGNLKFKSTIIDEDKKCFEFFYESGGIDRKYCEVNGKTNGKIEFYYETGELEQVGYYNNGLQNGENVTYYKNGKIKETASFKNDEKTGESIYYLKDGKIRTVYEYVNGKTKYKKLLNYNKTGELESVEESMVPVAISSRDTVYVGEEYFLEIRLPRFDDLERDKIDNYTIDIDIFKAPWPKKDKELPYPAYPYNLVNGKLKFQHIFENHGRYLVYGNLVYNHDKKEVMKENLGIFKIEVEVLEK